MKTENADSFKEAFKESCFVSYCDTAFLAPTQNCWPRVYLNSTSQDTRFGNTALDEAINTVENSHLQINDCM